VGHREEGDADAGHPPDLRSARSDGSVKKALPPSGGCPSPARSRSPTRRNRRSGWTSWSRPDDPGALLRRLPARQPDRALRRDGEGRAARAPVPARRWIGAVQPADRGRTHPHDPGSGEVAARGGSVRQGRSDASAMERGGAGRRPLRSAGRWGPHVADGGRPTTDVIADRKRRPVGNAGLIGFEHAVVAVAVIAVAVLAVLSLVGIRRRR
jgi:hypothetical protein